MSSTPGTDRPFLIVPSVLPVDFARLGDEVVALEKAGVDRIQWDIMDGRFVPNITFGPDLVASVRDLVVVPFEAHLMIEDPAWVLPQFVEAGCSRLIVHAESTVHLHRVLHAVHDAGASAAVAINPSTPADAVENVLDLVDMVLVMTVNPGFGGQRYIDTMERKISQIRTMVVERGLDVDIEVDGGIGPSTVAGAAAAGANVLVAGSALFRDRDGLGHAVTELRELAASA
jgi:ribulose-phosphate 3-epimerase